MNWVSIIEACFILFQDTSPNTESVNDAEFV
jgi:hypothetical protein